MQCSYVEPQMHDRSGRGAYWCSGAVEGPCSGVMVELYGLVV